MAMPWIYAVRLVQILFGLIVVALTAYGKYCTQPPKTTSSNTSLVYTNTNRFPLPLVISTYSYWWSFSDTVNFLLFLGCWTTFVATPYLLAAPIYFPRLAHRFVIPAVEVITMIFWFAGFIAIGAQLPKPAYCTWSGCRALQAVTVFGAFEW